MRESFRDWRGWGRQSYIHGRGAHGFGSPAFPARTRIDAPRSYGPHKTIYNRFIRWSRLGVFNRIFVEVAGKAGEPDRIMIDATHLKGHRTAARLLRTGIKRRPVR